MFDPIINFIRDRYGEKGPIPLHAPLFMGSEREFVIDAIDSTFVSSVGAYVSLFEQQIAEYTKSPSAVVTVNGTSALHIALLLAGVTEKDYVITQALTFVATGNAIAYCHATPIFIDVDKNYLGLCPQSLEAWLQEHAYVDDRGQCLNKQDHRIIRACLPMHTFGHPVDMDLLQAVCQRWSLIIIEDAAESLGSFYKGRHTGTIGEFGILSFNGNKIITTGGGGMILSKSEFGERAKHLTTTAKRPHPYEFYHDEMGYNYRMPNINAALGCAQLNQLESYVSAKRQLAKDYEALFANTPYRFIKEPPHSQSNYWLNAVICKDRNERDDFLRFTNENEIMTRPIWSALHHLPMYKNSPKGPLNITEWLEDRVVNLPSGVVAGELRA